jgi:hypothetical protein
MFPVNFYFALYFYALDFLKWLSSMPQMPHA